jgi:aminomethyltransferase
MTAYAALPRRTPLHDTHLQLGATMTDFVGWTMPLRYGSETTEHKTVRAAAGVFDLSHMGEIEVTGSQAAEALNYALVSDVAAIAVTKAKYTMICRPDGGIIDDLIVYRLADHRYLIVANAANASAVLLALRERIAGFDVEVLDRSDDWALIAIQGPAAAAILSGPTDSDLGAIKYYAIAGAQVAGRAVLLARTGYTGEDGFEIFCTPGDAEPIWHALIETGGGRGLVPAGLASRDTLRLEAGMPLYGHELSTAVTPYAAGLGHVVALAKGSDFVGRAALAAQSQLPPARRLVGLAAAGRRAPRAGYAVLDPVTGASVGQVTSGAPSPTLGHPVAMAYIDTALTAVGTEVHIDLRGTAESARVIKLPFYRRAR